MGMRVRKPIRMAQADVTVAVAIRRRGLRQPRRITDRAESSRHCMDVVADGLQPLQYGLPLFPIELPQERPQALDEGIFQQRFAVGFRDEEPVQADVERLGDLLQCAEAGRRDCSWLWVMLRDSRNWRMRWPIFSTVSWLTNFSVAGSAAASSAGAGGGIRNSRRWGKARTQRRQFPVRVRYWTRPHVLQRMTSRSNSNELISFSNCTDTGTPR